MEGYIQLHRQMLEWEWYKDANTARVFIHLLLKANWKKGKWRGIEIDRGQLVTSRAHLAKECRISEQSVRTALTHLKSTGEITIETTNRYSLITIAKYDKYQSGGEAINQQTDRQINQVSTNNQPTTNQQPTTIEERNKGIKKKGNHFSYPNEKKNDGLYQPDDDFIIDFRKSAGLV